MSSKKAAAIDNEFFFFLQMLIPRFVTLNCNLLPKNWAAKSQAYEVIRFLENIEIAICKVNEKTTTSSLIRIFLMSQFIQ